MKKGLLAAAMVVGLSGTIPAVVFAKCDKCDATPADRDKQLDKLASDLKLSADQKEKVRAIKAEKYSKMEAAMSDARTQIRAVLTPEQVTKFDKMMEKKDKH